MLLLYLMDSGSRGQPRPSYPRVVRVLLSSVAHDRYWDRIDRPGLQALVMEPNGDLRPTQETGVTAGSDDAEVAWGTSDLFLKGAPLHQFFDFLRKSQGLRWLQAIGAGFDAPVFSELAAKGVRITNAHVNNIPISEFVMRAVLDRFQRADLWRGEAEARRWRTHDFREVYGSTWVIVGLGAIGSAVAVRARAFGATVIGCRRHPSPHDPTDRTVTPELLRAELGAADVVVLALPAGPSSVGLVDADFLEAMAPGSLLVNVARGRLVVEAELLSALDRGAPEAAVLDVTHTEPLPADHPFWAHPAITITPHNAAGGTGRYGRQADLFLENLESYLLGRPLRNDVTDDVLRQG